jgi:pimeloyl-ACP methyl ester carboxylesterase
LCASTACRYRRIERFACFQNTEAQYQQLSHRGHTAPLLFLHGERDGVVPITLGERLYMLANEPKRLVRFSDAGHNELGLHGAQDAVRVFLPQH